MNGESLSDVAEEREVHAAIAAMLDEVWVGGEVVVLSVFEDEDAVGLQQSCFEDETRYLGQSFESVGRIGKDDVELLMATFQKAENVASYEYMIFDGKRFHALSDESGMIAVGLNAYYLTATARQQFERNAARAREKVESCGAVEVDIAVKHIEKVFLGEVGCGPGFERSGYVEVSAFVFSCDYSHPCSA